MQKYFSGVVTLLLTFFISYSSTVFAKTSSAETTNKPPLEDIQRFTAAISYIKNYYVHSVKENDLFENAIRGMLESLDPHSAYLDEEEFNDLNITTTGEFGGLGLEVILEDGAIKVITPLDDSPASKAGIKPKDQIIMIDKTAIRGMSLREAINKMRGPKGSKVRLTILREKMNKPLILNLTRDIIKVDSVKSLLFDDKYGYLRVSNFQADTPDEMKQAIKKFQEKTKGNLRGIVLDLRNNPGGLLDSAIEVADLFLSATANEKDNVIVYTKGRISGSQFTAYAKYPDLLKGLPIVVLINEGSASAAEIVAGALQDHKRALVIGMRSFGKGSVQTVLPLDEHHAVKLTTALYYTPAGHSIQAKGIEPNIEVKNVTVNKNNNANHDEIKLNEASLERHLANGTTLSTQKKLEAANDGNLIFSDFQLYQALVLLKGLAVTETNH